MDGIIHTLHPYNEIANAIGITTIFRLADTIKVGWFAVSPSGRAFRVKGS